MEGPARVQYSMRIAPFCALACAFLGALFLGLGGLRLFSISLENRLNLMAIQLEEAREMRAGLQARVALQAAPPRVYDKARFVLGMTAPSTTALVLVPDDLKPSAEGAAPVAEVFDEAGLIEGLFVSQASAHD